RYLAEDDLPRAIAASELIDGERRLVVSTAVLFETVHVLRTQHGFANPRLATVLIELLSRQNVELADADAGHVVAGLTWTLRSSSRRIPDAVIAAAATQAASDWIATFDEAFASPTVPSRLL
ncbi:MAG: PIN domain-containing protein, partial [Chloroflexota bacterium]|nr:PIN domain-containing protein [Chloroflexota bacterium]